MRFSKKSFRLIGAALLFGAAGILVGGAQAQSVAVLASSQLQPSGKQARELHALMRALDFVRGLPDKSSSSLSIVYDTNSRDSEAEADTVIALLKERVVAGTHTLGTLHKISVQELEQAGRKSEVLYLTRGLQTHYPAIYQHAVKHHVFTMSADQSCVVAQACILSAISENTVQILLNQQTMRAIGFDFDAAFKFIAKQV